MDQYGRVQNNTLRTWNMSKDLSPLLSSYCHRRTWGWCFRSHLSTKYWIYTYIHTYIEYIHNRLSARFSEYFRYLSSLVHPNLVVGQILHGPQCVVLYSDRGGIYRKEGEIS